MAAAAAAAGKNAVIKGSFPFVMQTYDRPTLTLLPLSLFVCLSLSLSLSLSPLPRGKRKKPFAAQWSGTWNERNWQFAHCGEIIDARARRNKHRTIPFPSLAPRHEGLLKLLFCIICCRDNGRHTFMAFQAIDPCDPQVAAGPVKSLPSCIFLHRPFDIGVRRPHFRRQSGNGDGVHAGAASAAFPFSLWPSLPPSPPSSRLLCRTLSPSR